MTKLSVALAFLALSGSAVASTWKSDPAHSAAGFAVKHMMVSTVKGTLGPITSTVMLDDKDITKSKIETTIDVTKVNTGNEKRDQHLNSPEFFDTAKFATAKFVSKKIEKAGDKYKITGDLTLKDKTKEVVLDATISPEVANPFTKMATRGVSATGTINRDDFGLIWNVPVGEGVMVGKEIKIELDVEYTKDDGKAAAPAPAKK